MEPFLKQVARGYFGREEFSRTCFVFPNRRSLVFFQKYLCGLVAGSGRGPMMLPELLTINDFFYRIADADVSDRVTLLLELYDCYKALNSRAEPLDEFIFWGDILLADFSDVDKYLIDPEKIFTNVKDFREIQDGYSYLSDGQREAIEQFMKHFKDSSRRGWVKERFLGIWNILLPLYKSFGKVLKDKHMAYDGMVYRALAERLAKESASDILNDAFPGTERYVFIGLNALSTSEKTVLRKMKDARIADFCWDYSSPMIRNPRNRSSFFMDANIELLGQSFKADENGLPQTEFNVVSVPSSVGQAKHLASIIGPSEGESTAIVIPDEGLLQPVLSSIPPEITDINVTMGYPLGASAFAALMAEINNLQLHLRGGSRGWMFYHKQVWNIFSSNVFREALGEKDREIITAIKAASQYYVPLESFKGSPILETVFRPVAKSLKAQDKEQIKALAVYQNEVIKAIAPHLKEKMPQEVEFARRYSQCVTRLASRELEVMPQTYVRLLGQLTAGESVPYNGEPVKGLQVMGPLETRALDFDKVIILSCNEGTFPRRSVSASFIPPELRRGFGMPTYEYQDAVWAYYFYRLVQRAGKVWMLYDSRTEGLRSGEESRYIKQLQYHFGVKLNRYVSKTDLSSNASEDTIPKPADMEKLLKERPLSPSALQKWLECPVMFYYSFIEGLQKEDEVAESLDAGHLGNVFHETMHCLFTGEEAMAPGVDPKSVPPSKYITADYLKGWSSRKADIKAKVRSVIMKEMNTVELTGRNLVIEEVITNYVLKTIERELEILPPGGRFEILGLEQTRYWDFEGYKFKGKIDRLDSIYPGKVRVVDYKTGKVLDEDVLIDSSNADAVMKQLFGTDSSQRPKIALQMFLYDMYLGREYGYADMVNAVYPVAKMFKSPPMQAPVCQDFCDRMKGGYCLRDGN